MIRFFKKQITHRKYNQDWIGSHIYKFSLQDIFSRYLMTQCYTPLWTLFTLSEPVYSFYSNMLIRFHKIFFT